MRFPLSHRSTRILMRLAPCVAALGLLLAPAASAQATFCETGGLIVAQIESVPAHSGWVAETSKPGFTGTSYYRWAGPNFFSTPGQGTLTYTLNVTTPGLYHMRLRNLHDNPDATIENDCWTRMDNTGWIKTFSPFAAPDWNWATWFDPGFQFASYNLTAGPHTFQISARSTNYRIDRVHFFLDGTPQGQGLFHPESVCNPTWDILSHGKPGTGGLTPTLNGLGNLSGGTIVTLNLAQARANAPATLFVGLNDINAPFKGGIVVPDPDIIVTGLQTNGSGALTVAAVWPGLPGGLDVFFQYWVSDPLATFGLSASNGLKGTTP